MTIVDQIKAAIATLSPDQRAELEDWLVQSQQEDDEWDRQMSRDVRSGKLDSLLNEVRADIKAGLTEEGP